MNKLLFLFFVFSNFLFADYLLDTNNFCIKSYYFSGGSFCYLVSSTNQVACTQSTASFGSHIFSDYDYNATDKSCRKAPSNNTLGMKNEDFNYLNAFVGLMIFAMLLVGLL